MEKYISVIIDYDQRIRAALNHNDADEARHLLDRLRALKDMPDIGLPAACMLQSVIEALDVLIRRDFIRRRSLSDSQQHLAVWPDKKSDGR